VGWKIHEKKEFSGRDDFGGWLIKGGEAKLLESRSLGHGIGQQGIRFCFSLGG
jgi:hypothetical protein